MRFILPRWCVVPIALAALNVGCGGSDSPTSAVSSDIVVGTPESGETPFISRIKLSGSSVSELTSVEYVIAPKPGAASKAVNVSFTAAAAVRRGYLSSADGSLSIPIFGLYANHANAVTLQLTYKDGSSHSVPVRVSTAAYSGPYGSPDVLVRRTAGSALGFDYFYIKSNLGSPIVIDTDGEIRWATNGIVSSPSSIFSDNGFVVGLQSSPGMLRVELDGSSTPTALDTTTYTRFHHNVEFGKTGLLAELDNGTANQGGVVAEITTQGTLNREWDFATIIGDYMRSQGDDPSNFVRGGSDWFHMNSAIYDPEDDTIIASSRENFVIKVDYQTGQIRWILGDPTKYWYTFPSLRAKALTVAPGGRYPIGQHALSIRSDGLLMLFNNGAASFNQPPTTPAGETRNYSALSAYAIDAGSRTATESWSFEHGQSLFSDICSSAYEAAGKSILISYAATENRSAARLIGIDAQKNVIFDFRYPSPVACTASWNAAPIPFDALKFE